MTDSEPRDGEICTFCGLPIEAGQARTTVNGKPMHTKCYQEQTGGPVV